MFPLNVILVGIPEPLTGRLRSDLADAGGDVAAALPDPLAVTAQFASDFSPRLLVTYIPTGSNAAHVRQLRDAYLHWPILALAEAEQGAALLAANRAGADQVVPLPLNDKDLADALEQISRRFRPNPTPCLTVAVTGAVTGCGASTLAANLAYDLAVNVNLSTLLVEVALQMGVQAINLDAKPKTSLADLVATASALDVTQVRKAVTQVAPNLTLLAGPTELTRHDPNAVQGVLKVLSLAKRLADVVIADVPCTYDDLHFETLWSADRVVLVADQSIPAVRTARMILDAVGRAKGVKGVHVVLNRYDPAISGLTVEKVSSALGGETVLTIPNEYAGVMKAASVGKPLMAVTPNCPIAVAVRDLSRLLTGHCAEPPAASGGLFARLFGPHKPRGGS